MEFANISALWLVVLAILPILGIWWSRKYRIFVASNIQKRISPQFTWIRAIFASSILVGISLVLANPIHTEYVQNPLKTGIDIYFVLDLSKSMLAEDIKPNRIIAGKGVLTDFIEKRTSDRIGLIGFAGKPFIFSPLTFDTKGLVSIVNNIGVDSIKQELPGLSGTAIGDGLLLGSDGLVKSENTASGTTESLSTKRRKVLILLTDGEANVGIDPKVANEYVKKTGVTVYTIGIGSPSGTELYTTDDFGKKHYFMDQNGVPIRASIDEALLRLLAEDTGGSYANASSAQDLQAAFNKLNSLFGTPVVPPPEIQVISYVPKIAIGIGILLCIWLIMEMFSLSGAFQASWLSGVTLTKESMNFIRIPSLLLLKRGLLIIGSVLLIVGYFGYTNSPTIGTITILIDTSKSMLVQDVGESRLSLAKKIAEKIINTYPSQPVRLATFAGGAQTLVPATYDRTSLEQGITSLSPDNSNTGGPSGTNIIGAIQSVVGNFGGSSESSSSNLDTSTIFLISDGEAVGEGATGLNMRTLHLPSKISLWTIGVGTEKGGTIPFGEDLFGNSVVKEVNGKPVVSKYSEDLLKQLPSNGGKYIHAQKIDDVRLSNNTPTIHKIKVFAKEITALNFTNPLKGFSLLQISTLFILLAILLPYRKLQKKNLRTL